MSKLALSAAFTRNRMTREIATGAVEVDGTDLRCSTIHASELFWRQLRYSEFDISEMSLSSLMISHAKGIRDWTAIPVFTTRRFFHVGIQVRRDSGILSPADLAGRRVGVPEYQQTAAVWARGALQHEFGVDLSSIEWVMERVPERSHGDSIGFVPPAGITIHRIGSEESLGGLLLDGRLDATLHYLTDSNLVDRSRVDISASAAVRDLFDDPRGEAIRYYRATNLLPVNHCVVIRSSLLAEHPWLALNVYGAFVRAKEIELARTRAELLPWLLPGWLSNSEAAPVLERDPLPYGILGQEDVLSTLATYIAEQGLLATDLDFREIFAPSTLGL